MLDSWFFTVCLQSSLGFEKNYILFVWISELFFKSMSFLLNFGIFGICQMTTAIAIEDVRREVKILRALTGHNNLVQFYDSYEDHDNVYIVME